MAIRNIYIKELQVDNYKSLKKSKISLQSGLNIIIGKNGAGKSNMLNFLYQYATRNYFSIRRTIRPLNTSFKVSIEYSDINQKVVVQLLVERGAKNEQLLESKNFYNITVNKSNNSKNIINNKKFIIGERNSKDFNIARDFFKQELQVLSQLSISYIKFQFPDDSLWLSKPTKFIIDETNNFSMDEYDFSYNLIFQLENSIEFNLDKVIDSKKKSNKTYIVKNVLKALNDFFDKKNINSFLKLYSPINQIRINPNINVYSNDQEIIVENLSIEFMIDDNWMPWSYLSDGTKRLFYLITDIVSSNDNLILVEEPELGIHPHQLFKILQFLKDQSLQRQIIISTHSPAVLDILSADELNRINIAFFEKGTKFKKMTKAEMEKARKYINSVGDLSYYWLHSDLEK